MKETTTMANDKIEIIRKPTSEPFEPENLHQAAELAKEISQAVIIPSHLRNKPADVYATLLLGRDLGLTPMQAIMGIYCIEGKPSLSAETAVALVKRSPLCKFFRQIESTPELATYETQRLGDPEPQRATYTIEDAQRANLAGRGTWKAHPASMLRARAKMTLARDVYPDVVGNVYDPDEIEEIRERAQSERVSAPPVPPKTQKAVEARTSQWGALGAPNQPSRSEIHEGIAPAPTSSPADREPGSDDDTPAPAGFEADIRPADELAARMAEAKTHPELDALAKRVKELLREQTITHVERDVLAQVYKDNAARLKAAP